MKRALIWLTLVVLFVPVATTGTGDGEKQVYGAGVSGTEVTSISTILDRPDDYQGRLVRVEGRVVDVCRHMGCWIEVEETSGGRIRVKVDDGVIVFPSTSLGRTTIAEGRVEVQSLTRDQYIQWMEHLAEESGKEFDPASVGDPPYQVVRIRGLGAVMEE